MRLTILSLATLIVLAPTALQAIEPITAPAIVIPSIPGGAYHSPASLVGGGCFYGGFASRLQVAENQRQLAAAELALIDRRVASFRPFRSFGQYGATYFVDHAWQLEQLAARQRLQCLELEVTNLWQERQALAAMLLANRPTGSAASAGQQ